MILLRLDTLITNFNYQQDLNINLATVNSLITLQKKCCHFRRSAVSSYSIWSQEILIDDEENTGKSFAF